MNLTDHSESACSIRALNALLRFLLWSALFVLINLNSSCSTAYYPSHINSSFIENKGETSIGGAVSLTAINLQASHAISPHLRLAGGLNAWTWSLFDEGESGIQGQMLTGYYHQLGERIYFEGYIGVGISATNEDLFSLGIIQPSIGFGDGQPKFLVSLRANYLNNSLFSDPDMGVILEPGESNKLAGLNYDLALTHRFIRENKTWFIQYGLSGGYTYRELGDNSAMTFVNFGVNWRLFSKK